jgi:2-hydroxy-6-oxonona-2,4-dienedioate hydrolase
MGSFVTSDGCTLRYAISGAGPRIVLTPGGREGAAVLAPLVAALEPHCTVMVWDRRNCGGADLWFDPDRSEMAMWADDLADLLAATGFGPCIVAGGSAGCRVSVNTAIRHPEVVDALILWSPSGGAFGSQFLGYTYHVPYIFAAWQGGMEAVAATPFFADRIAENPRGRDVLMAMDPDRFVATMQRWNADFLPVPGSPLTGIVGPLSAIAAPTLVFAGNDPIHPPEASRAIGDAIAHAATRPSPWSGQAWMDIFLRKAPGSVFDLYPQLVPDMLAFIAQHDPEGGLRGCG